MLQPPKFGDVAAPQSLGDHVSIGPDAVVRAASIGSCVRIGAKCVIGERCIIKDCVEIAPESVVPADCVLAPFTRWGGSPARMLDQLPDSYGKRVEFDAEALFAQLIK